MLLPKVTLESVGRLDVAAELSHGLSAQIQTRQVNSRGRLPLDGVEENGIGRTRWDVLTCHLFRIFHATTIWRIVSSSDWVMSQAG